MSEGSNEGIHKDRGFVSFIVNFLLEGNLHMARSANLSWWVLISAMCQYASYS